MVATASAILCSLFDPYLVLVADSAKHPRPVIPGGKMDETDRENGEPSPVACLRRETFEEVDTEVLNPRLIGRATDPERDVRFVPPAKLRGVMVSNPLPEDLSETSVVKAHYGTPDYIFVGQVDPSKVHETEELKNPRFIDIRTLKPGDLSAGHDVIVLWYRRMLESGASSLPQGALADFAAERVAFSTTADV
jgi:8-oxo-dGTP pyrophosphatase MutT (NUDIX family)